MKGKNPKTYKQSDKKKYKDSAVYKVRLKKGGTKEVQIGKEYHVFPPNEEVDVKGEFLNNKQFIDHEKYFAIREQ